MADFSSAPSSQRVKRGLDVRPDINPPIGKASAFGAMDCECSAFRIGVFAAVVAEIQLVNVALQVLFGAVLVDAFHAPLEDRKVVFDVVGCHAITMVDASAVIDRTVPFELFADLGVDAAFVGMQFRFAADVANKNIADGLGVGFLDMERAGFAARDERDDGALVGRAGLTGLSERMPSRGFGAGVLDLTEIGFIGLHRSAAHGAGVIVPHGFADTMRHEPCGFVGDAEHAV